MATRKPLVLIGGVRKELPPADTLALSAIDSSTLVKKDDGAVQVLLREIIVGRYVAAQAVDGVSNAAFDLMDDTLVARASLVWTRATDSADYKAPVHNFLIGTTIRLKIEAAQLTFDGTDGIRTKGAEGGADHGVLFFGSTASYILKYPAAFYFGNANLGVTATLNAGGVIQTSTNFDKTLLSLGTTTEAQAITVYPQGLSYNFTSDTAQTALTIRHATDNSVLQFLSSAFGGTQIPTLQFRTSHSSNGGGGFTALQTLVNKNDVVGRQMVSVMAHEMRPSVTGGCAPLAVVASGANLPDFVSLDFDPAVSEYAQFSMPMPERWDMGPIFFQFLWSHAATTTNFGVVFNLAAVGIGDNEPIAVSFGGGLGLADAGGTTNNLYASPISGGFTPAGILASADTLFFRIFRSVSNAGDTMAIDVRLHGLRIYFKTTTGVD